MFLNQSLFPENEAKMTVIGSLNFKYLSMDKKRLPICSLINEIKSNNYTRQAKVKSRTKTKWHNESEVEGSVATENIITQHETKKEGKTSGTSAHYAHKRKQSANVPYKMTVPHTNIEKLSNNDKNITESKQKYYPDYNNDMNEDEEEWNIGGDAEESNVHHFSQNTHISKSKISSNNNHFRSSTTKSGSSSLGQYKQSGGYIPHEYSPEDDYNFLTLECDEHLYEDDRVMRHIEEEEDKTVHISDK